MLRTQKMIYILFSQSFLFQSLLYKNAKEASNRSRLSSEMMIYHMTVKIKNKSKTNVFIISLKWPVMKRILIMAANEEMSLIVKFGNIRELDQSTSFN